MSGIVLSSSVRQNLLSLQSTADLLATTQSRLATGKKVNTALDNPTNFFTASSLDSRASDINNLLDGIGSGVQVLQAANTGISSLQKLIDSAKSVANQALQASVGYSTKSNFSATIAGASADNLLGAASYADAAATAGSVINDNHTLTPINNTVTGDQIFNNHLQGYQSTTFTGTTLAPTRTTAATLGSNTNISGALSTAGFAKGDAFTIQVGATTKTIQFYDSASTGANITDPTAGNIVGVDLNGTTGDGGDLVSAINTAFGATLTAALNGTTNGLTLTAANLTDSITVSDVSATNSVFNFSGFSAGSVTAAPTTTTPTAVNATLLSGTTNNAAGAFNLSGKSITVNGKQIDITGSSTNVTFLNGGTVAANGTLQDLVGAINTVAGSTVASINGGGQLVLATGTADDVHIADVGTGNALQQLGLAGAAGATRDVFRGNGGAGNADITGFSGLSGAASATSTSLASAITTSDTITVNGKTLTFVSGSGTNTNANGGQIDIATATVGDVLSAIDKITGTFGTANASSVSGGKITLGTGTASDLTLSDNGSTVGTVLAKLGLDPGVTARTVPPATTPITGATALTGAAGPTSNALPTAFTASDTVVINGKTISFSTSATTSTSATGGVINLTTGSVQDVVDAIDKITGTFGTANASTITGGQVTLHTGTAANLVTSGSGLAKLGLGTGGTTARTATGSLSGTTLTIGATGNGTATSITFGSGTGQVKSLNDLNNALASNNLLATLDGSGKLTIQTTNDAASSTIGTIGGTATDAGQVFAAATASAPVQDQTSLLNRANLVTQYNNILDQITTTAQDASYNGIALLNGDQLKLTFNETGSSTLNIQGVTFDFAGLGLTKLTAGVDFDDNSSANKELAKLQTASSTLRTQASAFGSNLSIVQIRQDFSKNLINVLQTGSSNLTLADTNEEAANSQALSTRQSIAVSALALANQSQQSVLQLLR